MFNNMQIEIGASQIDEMLNQMTLVKSFYYEHIRRKARHQQKRKPISISSNPHKAWKSMQGQLAKQSPSKIANNKLLSTFVNIKDARYQIGPAQTYNFKNIEFPDIGNRKAKSPKPKKNVENLEDSSERLNQTTKYIDRSHVKQSWNKYINMNSLSKSAVVREEKKTKSQTQNQRFYKKRSKDITEENIEGWKSFYNQEDQINVVGKS